MRSTCDLGLGGAAGGKVEGRFVLRWGGAAVAGADPEGWGRFLPVRVRSEWGARAIPGKTLPPPKAAAGSLLPPKAGAAALLPPKAPPKAGAAALEGPLPPKAAVEAGAAGVSGAGSYLPLAISCWGSGGEWRVEGGRLRGGGGCREHLGVAQIVLEILRKVIARVALDVLGEPPHKVLVQLVEVSLPHHRRTRTPAGPRGLGAQFRAPIAGLGWLGQPIW